MTRCRARVIGAIVLVLFGCDEKESKKAGAADVRTPAAPVATPSVPAAKPATAPPTAPQEAHGTRAAREDFVAQAKKHAELPFRVALGRSDTELVVELTDPNDVCTKDLVSKFTELLGAQIRGSGFKRVACKDQQGFVDMGHARGGSRAERQTFIDEAAKNPDLGFTLSYGQVDTDLMLELTPPPGSAGAGMPCSKEVLMVALVEPLRERMRAAGYKHIRCKGPLLTIDL